MNQTFAEQQAALREQYMRQANHHRLRPNEQLVMSEDKQHVHRQHTHIVDGQVVVHEVHEESGAYFLLLIGVMGFSQVGIYWWKKTRPRSFQYVTLFIFWYVFELIVGMAVCICLFPTLRLRCVLFSVGCFHV